MIFGSFNVNLQWQFLDILISFKVATLNAFEPDVNKFQNPNLEEITNFRLPPHCGFS